MKYTAKICNFKFFQNSRKIHKQKMVNLTNILIHIKIS